MKKLILTLLFPCLFFAQNKVEISEDYSTVLIFPSVIDTYILGNNQEYFVKQNNNSSSISRLALTIGYIKIGDVEKNTNLIVFTKDGNSYSFELNYAKIPKKIDPYYITLEQGTNNIIAPVQDDLKTVKVKDSYYTSNVETVVNSNNTQSNISNKDALYTHNKIAFLENYCKSHNETPKRLFRVRDKSSNIKFSLKDISFKKDELYFHLMIENEGGQAFDVDFINSKLARNYKGKATEQSIPLTPLFIFNEPKRIDGNSTLHFTMVYKKFTINDKKQFQIDLAEKEGERDLLLVIDNRLVNNPQSL